MRLKHVKGASEQIEKSNYIIKDPFKWYGKYNELFKNNNPIYIEVGMGKGDFIIQNALEYPNINFIGIEKYDSVIVRAIQKLEDQDIKNLKLIRMNANEIDKVFKKEISCLYLNFSDPWPKDRHAKRRLTSPYFLEKYEQILKENHIIMKTDNRHLFEYSIVSFVDFGYKVNDISLNLHDDNVNFNIETEYEKKFKAKGVPIYKIDVFK